MAELRHRRVEPPRCDGDPTVFINDRKVTPAQGQTITDAVFNAIAAQS